MAVGLNLKPFSEIRSDNRILISVASVVCTPVRLLVARAKVRCRGRALVRELMEFSIHQHPFGSFDQIAKRLT